MILPVWAATTQLHVGSLQTALSPVRPPFPQSTSARCVRPKQSRKKGSRPKKERRESPLTYCLRGPPPLSHSSYQTNCSDREAEDDTDSPSSRKLACWGYARRTRVRSEPFSREAPKEEKKKKKKKKKKKIETVHQDRTGLLRNPVSAVAFPFLERPFANRQLPVALSQQWPFLPS